VNEIASVDPAGWRKEGRDLLRAIAGGSIIGMPLLYTMEMWQHGMTVSEWHLLTLLAATLSVNFAFCFLSGFRAESSVPEAAREAVTAVGIAIVYSTVILLLIGEIQFATRPAEIIGKVLLEAAAVSVGVSFANAQIQGKSRTGAAKEGGESEADSDDAEDQPSPRERQLKRDLQEFAAVLAGATVFALNVAPTEEITLIAARLSPLQLLALLGASMLLCYVILFAAEFKAHAVHVKSALQHPLAETILTCAVSLTVAAVLLLLLGERDGLTHPSFFIASIVTLGLPAIVGGAAGRLII
jgi:putative integral membrane protein (TIGR02587 family)